MTLIALAWDGDAHPMPSSILANLAAAIASIADNSSWSQPGTPTARPLHGSLFHERLESRRFVPLAGRERDAHELAIAFNTNMDLGTEAALAAA